MSASKRSEGSNPPSKPSTRPRRKASRSQPRERKLRQPSVYTPELALKICATIEELGVSASTAAASNGVAVATLSDWLSKSEAGDPRYAGFAESMTRARATAECNMVRLAIEGGKGSSGAAFILERRFHTDYGRRERLEVSGDETAPLVVRAVRQFEQIQREVASDAALATSVNNDLARRHAETQTLALPGKSKS